jgi:HEAT repeat protein
MPILNSYRKLFESLIILLFIIFLIGAGEKAAAGNIDELIGNLQSSDRQSRLLAVEELGRIRNDKAIDALLNFVVLKDEDWRIKIRAIGFLGEIADPRVSEVLVKIFNDPFLNEECPAIKWNTAIALGKNFNKGSRAVDSLIGALNHNNLLIREAAIQSLGIIGDSRAVPFLIPALNDKSFAIKFSAIKALRNIGDPQAIPFLKRIADNDNDPYIKGEALSTLKNFSYEGR